MQADEVIRSYTSGLSKNADWRAATSVLEEYLKTAPNVPTSVLDNQKVVTFTNVPDWYVKAPATYLKALQSQDHEKERIWSTAVFGGARETGVPVFVGAGVVAVAAALL